MTTASKVPKGLALVGLALLAVGAATAARGAHAAASGWARTEVSQVRLVSAASAVGAGEALRLGLQFQLEPGWKIYWRSPGDAGSPPRLDVAGSTNLAALEMAWPAPRRFLEAADIETVGYLDEVVFPLILRPERAGAPVELRATVDYQVCEQICIPVTASLALDLPAGPARATPFIQLIERYKARVPGLPAAAGIEVLAVGLSGAPPAQTLRLEARSLVPFSAPELFVEAPARFRVPAGVAELAAGGTEVVLTLPVEARDAADMAGEPVVLTLADGGRAAEMALTLERLDAAAAPGAPALAAMLALALLGGLILNLMPCVLPVLSLKLFGVISHGGGTRRRVTLSFLASAAGIVASFLALAAAAVAVKLAGGAVGWGIQFQQPVFLIFVVLVLGLFAYNLLGLYEVRLPGWLGDAGLRAGDVAGGGLAGPFMTGAFATLLATPCSAPFLGTAVSFALSRGAGEIFAIFAALGLGMAVPYLLVAAFPGLATRLPRPGPWMVWLRSVLALALIGTAAWLLTVLAAIVGWPAAAGVALALLLAAPVIWLVRAHGALRPLGAGALAVLVVAAFAAPGALERVGPGDGREGAPADALAWRPFDPQAIAPAVADGQVVFVDVTADWCVTCKVNKRMVLESAEVAGRLGAPGVVRMRADWTRPDDRIAAYLASFARYGIPFNVVYGPGAPQGQVLPELLTRGDVLAALEAARARKAAAAD